jgi:proteasome activator subunit 4
MWWCCTSQGSLYVLLGPKQNPLVTRHDWDMLMNLWPAIVRTKPSEKLSVIRLMENIVDCVHKHFPTITISLQVSLLLYTDVRTRWLLTCSGHAPSHLCLQIPELCLDAARRLWDTSPAPCFSVVSEEEVAVGIQQLQMRNQYNSDQYLALLNSLMDAIQQENL